MPLGILTEEEFEQELSKANSNGNSQKARIIITEKGRGPKLEVPESARKLISEMAIEGAATQELSEHFNISPSSISAYKHGSTSTASYQEPNRELTNHNNAIRERIIRKARRKLVSAIDTIDDEKLSESSGRELAGIAKDMSAVIKNLEPEIKPEVNQNSQFIFFAPQIRKESDYPIIDVDN